MRPIELLAPAKNLDAGRAAITCGADAVYIGAKRYGAREAAGNSLDDIAALLQYAHTYWAKVYVTLNTLLYDEEIPDVVRLIHDLYHIGVDGLIIQDVGLLECDLPPIPLIASTQMHNATPEKVRFLEQIGIQRVILARELSLEQIRAIRAATSTIELECFVHGAVCVSYSGQCYLSHAIGGRSGNRGQCAQPCRRRYTLKDAQGRTIRQNQYLLSLKDMDRSDFLAELLDAGVTAFKIEGRLKEAAYVMNVVSYYRQKLDRVLQQKGLKKVSSGISSIDFTPNPQKTFQRGATAYFLTRREPDLASLFTPKSLGEPMGTVQTVNRDSFVLATRAPLSNGDGICFFDVQQELQGTVVNTVRGNTVYPDSMTGITPGLMVYRNYDHQFHTQLKKSRAKRHIVVHFQFAETPDGFTVAVTDEDDNRAEHRMQCEKTPAHNPDAARTRFLTQLGKCGDTAFRCADIQIVWSTPAFLPAAMLNALRREALAALTLTRAHNRPVVTHTIVHNTVPYPESELSYRGNVLNHRAEAFYRRHGVQRIQPAAESGLDLRGHVVMTTKYCLRYQLGYCIREQSGQAFTDPLYLVDENGQCCTLRFDCETCDMQVWWGRLPE